MLYFVNWDGDMSAWPGWYGILRSPRRATFSCLNRCSRRWIGDNDAFHGLFDHDAFTSFLIKATPYIARHVFIACPDVLGDAQATSERWSEYAGLIRNHGFRPAFVLQDGHEPQDIPPDAPALFLGGSTEYKFSDGARACLSAGFRWLHIGRVNSQRRLHYFQALGAHSADGTTINRGPEVKRRMLDSQLRQRALPVGFS